MSRLKTDAIRNVNASVDGITLDTSGNVAIPNELQLADKIVHTGDTNTAIRFLANDTVSVETAGTERLRVTSAGSLIVGNQTASNYKLCVSEAAHTRVEVISTNNNSAGAWFKVFNGGSITSQSTIRTSGGSLQIYTGTSSESERLRIDQYGRVMIGTTTAGDGGADDLNIATTGQTGITIRSGTGSGGQIYFADGTSGDDRQRGIISYQHGGNYMRFYTDALERLRIDSSGRVMINTTVEGRATYGEALTIAGSGHCGMTIRSGTTSYGILHFSDGTSGADEYSGMVEYLQGTNRMRLFAGGKYNIVLNGGGSTEINHDENKRISTTTAGVSITRQNAGEYFNINANYGGSGDQAIECSGDLTFYTNASNIAARLDQDGLKFNGDTAAVNGLNDYEEGTYTPVITCATSGGYNLNSSYYTMAYRKIGSFVHIQGYISIVSESGTPNGALRITLPKTAAALTQNADYTGIKILVRNHGSSNIYNQVAVTHGNGSYFNILFDDGNGASTYMTHAHVDTDWQFFISGGYIAT